MYITELSIECMQSYHKSISHFFLKIILLSNTGTFFAWYKPQHIQMCLILRPFSFHCRNDSTINLFFNEGSRRG